MKIKYKLIISFIVILLSLSSTIVNGDYLQTPIYDNMFSAFMGRGVQVVNLTINFYDNVKIIDR